MEAMTVLYKGDGMLKGLLVFVLAATLLTGCTTITIKGTKRIDEAASSIQKGETTKQDIVKKIGNPLEISHRDDNADIYVYERVTTTSIIPKYCWFALPVSLGLWAPCYMAKVQSDVTRLSVNVGHETGIVQDYDLDQLTYDGPYYRTAAEAAEAAARQAAARSAVIHQNAYKPAPTYTPQYHYGGSKY
jgi:hypothetical protein